MKKLSVMVLFIAFILSCFAPVYSADINNGINDKYFGETNPVITGKSVDCQIRIMEFVVGTRMTVANVIQIFMNIIIMNTPIRVMTAVVN